jgi:hypothetical protein
MVEICRHPHNGKWVLSESTTSQRAEMSDIFSSAQRGSLGVQLMGLRTGSGFREKSPLADI